MSPFGTKLRKVEGGVVMFWCPGCQGPHAISVDCGVLGRDWGFNGNPDRPTFTPSILVRQETWTPPVTSENLGAWKQKPWEQVRVTSICHSFVTDGQIQFLTDCTHAMAGQTVPLPNFDRSN